MAETINIPATTTRVFFRTYSLPPSDGLASAPSGVTNVEITGGTWFSEQGHTHTISDRASAIRNCVAKTNTGSASRSANVVVYVETGPDSRYDGIATATSAYTIVQAAGGSEPPTPTSTFTITNESNYALNLTFATTNGTFQQEFVGGYGQIVTISATTLPITVYEIAGSISPGSDYTKIVELYNTSGTITAPFETSYNAWYGTGQVTVDSSPGLNNMTIIVGDS